MTKLKQLNALIQLPDGTYAIYGLPYERIQACFPEFNFEARKAIIINDEEMEALYDSLVDWR